ncbi:putative atp-synthase s1 [Golovinomyces cichoracearum]|uniref:Protein BIG1 n=1 Tax=Golovinomyces cichoracearum TaxID=62708 RepID=A0A420IIK4_9PEZI|nr:putative atp-synthase s1 [Golovinomyces cichoracearum]
MHLSLLIIAIVSLQVQAFKDTSPFLLFSSSSLSNSIKQFPKEQIASREHVLKTTELFLSECPSDAYLILLQPSISASQLSNKSSQIRQLSKNNHVKTQLSVRDTVGLKIEDGTRILRYLETNCDSKGVVGWPLDDIIGQIEPGKSLTVLSKLEENEIISDNSPVNDNLKSFMRLANYTIIFLTTPKSARENVLPTDEYQDMPSHVELRRGLVARGHVISSKADLRPLFEKYQFFNPGLFAGIMISVILISILSVGIRAISSLEVSYSAFEKEMGPEKQKIQ